MTMPSSSCLRLLPFLGWFSDYSIDKFKSDLVAGITVALVLVPQSMAYAQLAGLPPYYGLYASFLPPMVAALFGSSRRLATGPVAVVSIMTAATLEPLATAGGPEYIAYAILLAFLVGLFQFTLGVLRLGMLVNLLSHPVVVGFTNAAALIIASSQFARLLGIRVDTADHWYATMARLLSAASEYIHWPSLAMGVLAMVIMVALKRWLPRVPNVLVAVALTTVLAWATGFENNRIVTLDQIQVPGLATMITRLNTTLDHIRLTGAARHKIEAHKKSGQEDRFLCSQCHTTDGMTDIIHLEDPAYNQPIMRMPKENILELHFMAGVLDQYIAGSKNKVVELRRRLRAMQLVAVREGDKTVYRLRDSAHGSRQQGTVWRLRIGRGPVDPGKVVLQGGGEVVGDIPRGLPAFGLPRFDWDIMPKLFSAAIIISMLGFMEAISIAKAVATRTGRKICPNQELIGQGLANMIGSCASSYPVSGSFSRSAVNYQAGARTGIASVCTSLMVLLTILLLTPLLYYLPQPVLAAIIILAVVNLFNVKEIYHAWRIRRSDGVISVLSFVATMAFAPHLDRGILIGVGASIAVFFHAKMKPMLAELSLYEDGHFRNVDRFNLRQCPFIVIIRFDGPLFFANISYLEREVTKVILQRRQAKIIIFKCNGINYIDATGETALRLLVQRLQAGGYEVYFSGLKVVQVLDVLRVSGTLEVIGEDHIYPTLVQALDAVWPRVHRPEDKYHCPLKRVMYRDERETAGCRIPERPEGAKGTE
jgi:MFS superfamily sulfate permease-like transporter